MATEGRKPVGMVKAAQALYKQTGMSGFYRGIEANVMRAMVLNGTKMGCYDQIKGMIKDSGYISNKLALSFFSAFGAGFFMACTVSPFDMVRTQLMNQKMGSKQYNGFIDCTMQIIKKSGPQGLYAGFFPIWARFAPTTTLQLVIFEQLKPIFGVNE